MKKLEIILLSVLFFLVLVACGGNTTTAQITTSSPTSTQVTTTAFPTTEELTTETPFDRDIPNGLFEYDPMTSPLRDVYFDIKSEFALNNLVMGIPIYRESMTTLYFSDRVELPLESYNESLNYYEYSSRLVQSDEGLTLLNGEAGKADEYTLRVATDTIRSDWNHLDSNNREELLARYIEAPYKWVLNGNKKELTSFYFDGEPFIKEISPEPSPYLRAKVFEFTLKDNLHWQYNPLTNTSSFLEGHEVIDAEDFVYSYKYAIRENFLAGILLEHYGILYADEYNSDTANYEDLVGIQAIDDLTFRLTFEDYISIDEVKEMLSDVNLAPLNSVMHSELGELYGNDIYSIAYSGNFYIEEGTTQYVRLVPNPMNLYLGNQFTAIEFKFEYQDEILIQDFNAGLYDVAEVMTQFIPEGTDIEDYKLTPSNFFKSLAINGREIAEDQGIYSSFLMRDFEPILANPIFQKALYYAIDREYITENIVDHKTPLADYLDPETDFFGDFHRATSGHAPGLALTYFNLALEVMSDTYNHGDTIYLTLAYTEEDEALALYLESVIEDELYSYGLDIGIEVELVCMVESYINVLGDYFPYLQHFYPNQEFLNNAKGDYDLYLTDVFYDSSYMYKNPIYNGLLTDLNKTQIEASYSLYTYDELGVVESEETFHELWSYEGLQELISYEPAVIVDGGVMDEIAVELIEVSPFMFSLGVPDFDSDVFEKIEFEVFGIGYDYGSYESVYERQVLTTDLITVIKDRGYIYQVKLWFELKYYPGITKEMELIVLLPMLVDEISADGTTATITLNTEDRDRSFLPDSVEVYLRNGSEIVGEVEYHGDTVIITGLLEGNEYVVKFLTDDEYSSAAEEDFVFKARFLT